MRRARAAAAVLVLGACRSTPSAGPAESPDPVPAIAVPVTVDSATVDTLGERVALDTAPRTSPARALPDPSTAVRFEVIEVADSTFVFHAPRAPWLRVGLEGIAVDPRRRDGLVARFTVLALRTDSATALITGQTTRVTIDHVALIARPPDPAPPVVQVARVTRSRFWWGVLAGAGLGFAAGVLAR